MIENAVLIAGPTASGKSAAALDLARRENRVIVNADSMQVYRGLAILSAAPSAEETVLAPHLLYGHVAPSVPYSAGAWLRDVAELAASGAFSKCPPIFVGGTGLYFRALCGGLARIPETPPEIREHWRTRLAVEGSASLHRRLDALDPAAASKLSPTDGQRIVRALEVRTATGRSLAAWQREKSPPLIDLDTARRFVLQPERTLLAARIRARFEQMLRQGAVEEARAIGHLELAADLPATKAIGLRELLDYDAGRVTLADATERAVTASRQYAKRQATWFRHQLDDGWALSTTWQGGL